METSGVQKDRRIYRRLRRWLLVLTAIGGIPLALLTACQSRLLYFPRPYEPGATAQWSARTKGIPVDFNTSQGRQREFLQGNLTAPRNLWIVCGGNGTLSLDWSEWIAQYAPKEDAWLLFDYPGYGACEGSPSPARIRESLQTGVPLALEKLGWQHDAKRGKLRFFGHSLGCAAALIAASEFNIQQGVLISPFTSTMDMSREVTGLPLGFLVWHRFNNAERLEELSRRGPGQVMIFHGLDDEVIPVAMSRRLAAKNKDVVQLIKIPGGRHNTIQDSHAVLVADALNKIGQ